MFWRTFWQFPEAKEMAMIGVVEWVLSCAVIATEPLGRVPVIIAVVFAAMGGILIRWSVGLVHQRQHAEQLHQLIEEICAVMGIDSAQLRTSVRQRRRE